MSPPVPLQMAVEDPLSEYVLRRILTFTGRPYMVGACYGKQGAGYLKKHLPGFNNAAKGVPFLVLTDLDMDECAPAKIRTWLRPPRSVQLIIRVAVREVESWIIADRRGLASFLSVAFERVPRDPESVTDPKRTIIELAKHSRKRDIRQDIVPHAGSTARVGPNYNGRLRSFVDAQWDITAARHACDSLDRAVKALAEFEPF